MPLLLLVVLFLLYYYPPCQLIFCFGEDSSSAASFLSEFFFLHLLFPSCRDCLRCIYQLMALEISEVCFAAALFLCDAGIEDQLAFNKTWRRHVWCLPQTQAAKLWQPSSNASLVPILSVCCLRHLIDPKNLSMWALPEACSLSLTHSLCEGSQMQIKRSGWHQNWQVRNTCALPASRQIGRLGDGMDYPWCAWGFGEPGWNKQFPLSATAEWGYSDYTD